MIAFPDMLKKGLRLERPDAARVQVAGGDAGDYLHRMVTADVAALLPGRGAPSFLLERNGRVVDRVIVVRRDRDHLLLGSPGRAAVDVAWLTKYVIADDVQVTDVTPATLQLTVIGEPASEVLRGELGVPADDLDPWAAFFVERKGAPITVVRAENLGTPSFHVVGPRELRDELAKVFRFLPEGDEEAYRGICLATGVPRFGSEYTERTLPLETGMLEEISFAKGCFLGQEVLARLHHQRRVKRQLLRLRLFGEPPPSDAIVVADDVEVGRITDAIPWLDEIRAFAYVDAAVDPRRASLAVLDGGREWPAELLEEERR